MVTKKLRTECSCHPVALIIPAIVVPLRCLSRARTVSCLVLRKAGPTFLRFAVLFGRVVDAMFVRMLLCDIYGIPSVATAHAPPPPKPHSGDIASGAGSAAHRACVNIGTTDALFAAEVQSFLEESKRRLALVVFFLRSEWSR